jgi:DNA-binding beta-propeller fold protein YncE
MQLHRTLTLTAAVAAAFASTTPAMASTFASMSQAGATYLHTTSGGFNAEIAAYDAQTRTLWVSGVTGVDVLNVAPTGLSFNSRIDLSSFGAINSIAIHNGIAAFAIENTGNREAAGIVQFYNTSTRSLTSGINSVTVGSLPDMLTFTADGSKLLVANEGTPNTYPSATDPTGGVSIIRMSDRTVTNVGLGGSIPTTGSGLRGAVPFNYEPEYIAVNKAGTKAWVTLQEHNAVATLDLTTNQFTGITGLGLKDYSLTQNAIDSTDRPAGAILLTPVSLKGAYQPDAVVSYETGGKTFLVMANEGDAQDEDPSGDIARASSIPALGISGNPGRINVIKDMSSAGNVVTMGGRSFSIRDTDGNIVFDSGNILEAQAIARGIYDDGRSDDKGVEPEGVALQTINGRTFAFIGLERTTTGAVAIFDITDPANSSFVDMIVTNGTKRPEGVVSFAQDGMFYLAIANEGASATDGMSTALYSLAPVPEPETWALLLAGLGVLGLRARRQKSR